MPKKSNKEYRDSIVALMNAEKDDNKVQNFRNALLILDFLIQYNVKRTYFSDLLMITQSGFQKKMNGISFFTDPQKDIIFAEIEYLKENLDPIKGAINADPDYLKERRASLRDRGFDI